MKHSLYLDIGSNHNGLLDRAKMLIDNAALLKDSFCDYVAGVKFQAYDNSRLWAPNTKYTPDSKSPAIQLHWLPELAKHANDHNLEFGITTFDEKTLEDISSMKRFMECDVYFKISSSDIMRESLIKRTAAISARIGKPIHISTGGAKMSEVKNALLWAMEYTNSIILYHCIYKYPCRYDEVGLSRVYDLEWVANSIGDCADRIVLGYSDHSANIPAILSAWSLVGNIEIHYDDNSFGGNESKIGHVMRHNHVKNLLTSKMMFDAAFRNKDVDTDMVPDLRADPSDGMRPVAKYRGVV